MPNTWIFMTPDDKTAAEALNNSDAQVLPRIVDNPSADSAGFGTLVGLYVVGTQILTDDDYSRWWSSLSLLPQHIVAADVLFLPPDPNDL